MQLKATAIAAAQLILMLIAVIMAYDGKYEIAGSMVIFALALCTIIPRK